MKTGHLIHHLLKARFVVTAGTPAIFYPVVTRLGGHTLLTLRGPETTATTADCPPEGEWLGIRFKLGAFMPEIPPRELCD